LQNRKKIFAIIGSASENSANEKLISFLKTNHLDFDFTIFTGLKKLPHFDPELSLTNPPDQIIEFRNSIEKANGIIICTPEYVFSIPSSLKNAIEWCIATTIFENKPTALITASAHGQKAHEELQLIMKTVSANFTTATTLLIQGIKGKVNLQGGVVDISTGEALNKLFTSLISLL